MSDLLWVLLFAVLLIAALAWDNRHHWHDMEDE